MTLILMATGIFAELLKVTTQFEKNRQTILLQKMY